MGRHVPNRILREGILTSPKLAKLTWPEEVLYRRLMSVVDDFGRYFADVGIVRGHLYPRQLTKVSDADVGKWLDGVQAAGLVSVYPASDGERYLVLLNFGQQVRATKSKYPPPLAIDSNLHQTQEVAHLDVSVSVSVSEGESAAPPPAPKVERKKSKTAMPPDFGISDAVKAWAVKKSFGRLQEHLDAFKLKVAANGYTYVDWDAAFMGAVRDDWAKLRTQGKFGGADPAATVTENPQVAETRARLDAEARRPIASREEIAAIKAARKVGEPS